MSLDALLQSGTLLFVLLNPFLLVVYLLDLVRGLGRRRFASVLLRAGLISFAVFTVAAWSGERLFTDVLNIRYESFLVFGGAVFLLLAIRMVFGGPSAIESLRGPPEHVEGSVAMPFLIGPGTINASILAGVDQPLWCAALAILLGLMTTLLSLLLLKELHDRVRRRDEKIVERYVDLVGRISALVTGGFAVDMILTGLGMWQESL